MDGKGQDAEGLKGQIPGGLVYLVDVRLLYILYYSTFHYLIGMSQDGIQGAFGEHDGLRAIGLLEGVFGDDGIGRDILYQMHGGHHLAVGIEGHFVDARQIGILGGFLAYLELLGEIEQSQFSGIAIAVAVYGSVGIEHHAFGKKLQFRHVEVGLVRIDYRIVGIDLLYCHAVLGQSASLIGANDCHRTEGFHGRKLPDDGVDLDHP